MSDPLVTLADQLDLERDQLVQAGSAAIFTELDSYRDISRDVVDRSLGMNVQRAIRTLRDGFAPDDDTDAEAATITRERAEQGVPIEDIIRAYRISLRVIHARFVQLAGINAVPADDVLRGSNLLWLVGDWFTARAAIQYQSRSVDSAVRRASFLSELVGGNATVDEAAVSEFGLDAALPYAFVVGSPVGDQQQLRRVLERTGSLPGAAAVVGQMGDLVVGLVAGDPEPGDTGVVAMAPHRPLSEASAAAAVASRIFALVRSHPPGRYGIADVSWRLAATADAAVTAHLHGTYIAPLEAEGEFGYLVLESVAAFLSHDRSVRDAAAALIVHQNTLRYRLLKFEELTGASLQSTDSLVELSWALEARKRARLEFSPTESP